MDNLKEKRNTMGKDINLYFCCMKKFFYPLTLAVTLLLTSCDVIDYHPYDTRVKGKHNLNTTNIAQIEAICTGRDSIKFAVISDTQRWYDETKQAVNSINAQGDVDFVVHCGDLSDFGVTREFTLQRDILEKLNMPYVVLIGNHDCLGTGGDTYRYLFGDANFSFNAGPFHFVCLNTNAFEYDYSTAIPNFTFLRNDYSQTSPDVVGTVVAMHAMPHSDQFNNNVADVFEVELHKYPNLKFCLCGHGHKRGVDDIFGDNMLYYECGAAKSREYLLFTMKKDGTYVYEVVKY